MKTLKNLLFATILGVSSLVSAQEVGHIKIQDIIELLPGKKAADEQLIAKQKEYEQELKTMQADFQTALEKAQKDVQEKKLDPKQQQALETEFIDKQKRIEDFKKTATNAIEKQNEALYEPILVKLRAAIKTVAAKKGLKYILDASAENIVLIAEGVDITKDVKKELGIKE